MTRESCIAHPPKQAIAIVRQDYYELMDRDACAAALLNIFEYWANAALATDVTVEQPWVGARPIREFEQMLLGIATDKQIRKRLALLEERGFIQTKAPAKRGAAKEYQVLVPDIQRALVGQMTGHPTVEKKRHRSNNLSSFGQTTDERAAGRSFDPLAFGHLTDGPLVKQPPPVRSNDRALKKISKELKKEDLKERDLENVFSLAEQKKPAPALPKLAQPSEQIDLAELWIANPEKARAQVKAISPGHRRPEMVAHGVGQWWIGPGLNDFDEYLIQACRNRKRKFQQPDSASDAKTFINNMLRNGDWGKVALRCEEAQALRRRAAKPPAKQIRAEEDHSPSSCQSPFERSDKERQASALGLARFKVGRGDIEAAKAIAQQFGLSMSELGLVGNRPSIPPRRQAA